MQGNCAGFHYRWWDGYQLSCSEASHIVLIVFGQEIQLIFKAMEVESLYFSYFVNFSSIERRPRLKIAMNFFNLLLNVIFNMRSVGVNETCLNFY